MPVALAASGSGVVRSGPRSMRLRSRRWKDRAVAINKGDRRDRATTPAPRAGSRRGTGTATHHACAGAHESRECVRSNPYTSARPPRYQLGAPGRNSTRAAGRTPVQLTSAAAHAPGPPRRGPWAEGSQSWCCSSSVARIVTVGGSASKAKSLTLRLLISFAEAGHHGEFVDHCTYRAGNTQPIGSFPCHVQQLAHFLDGRSPPLAAALLPDFRTFQGLQPEQRVAVGPAAHDHPAAELPDVREVVVVGCAAAPESRRSTRYCSIRPASMSE